jgi:quinol monooxygenase YgiN
METLAVMVLLEAKPGKEEAVAAFLASALPLVRAEPKTLRWYALRLGPAMFGIFDTFAEEDGRRAHLTGPVAAALSARAEELFVAPPAIASSDILAFNPAEA